MASGGAASSSRGDDAAVRLYERCDELLSRKARGVPATRDEVAAIEPLMGACRAVPRLRPSRPVRWHRRRPRARAASPAPPSSRPPSSLARALSDAVEARHVGLSPPAANDVSTSAPFAARPCLQYVKLHDCPAFTMGVFAFPRGAAIPLHNHPGMTVMSKLLYGRLRVRSFDWVDGGVDYVGASAPVGVPRLARIVYDGALAAPAAPFALYPASGGNVHEFTALEPAAVMDVLSPPYAVGNGRDCHYFEEVAAGPGGEPAAEGFAWLAEIECPDDFGVDRAENNANPKFGSEKE